MHRLLSVLITAALIQSQLPGTRQQDSDQSIPRVRDERFSFSVLRFNDTHIVEQDDDLGSVPVSSVLGVPLIFHRSHRYTLPQLHMAQKRMNRKVGKGKQRSAPAPPDSKALLEIAHERVVRNLASCAKLNDGSVTAYYDNTQAEDLIVRQLIPYLTENEDAFRTSQKILGPGATVQVLSDAWERLNTPPLASVFVLKADLLRLAATFLHGGWWLDADIMCIDPINTTLSSAAVQAEIQRAYAVLGSQFHADGTCSSPSSRSSASEPHPGGACFFAWEGELPSPPSCPLQWAFGCPRRHPLLLLAISLLAQRILSWAPVPKPDPFAARVTPATGSRKEKLDKAVYVPVLQLTGPGLVCEALERYGGLAGDIGEEGGELGGGRGGAAEAEEGGRGGWEGAAWMRAGGFREEGDGGRRQRLVDVRRLFGERDEGKDSWARVSVVPGPPSPPSPALPGGGAAAAGGEGGAGSGVVVLPYCFFRSRGCDHLRPPYNDSVIFHHEFDTSWRFSGFHNYYKHEQ